MVREGWEPDFGFLHLILHSCLAEHPPSCQVPKIYCVLLAQISSVLINIFIYRHMVFSSLLSVMSFTKLVTHFLLTF